MRSSSKQIMAASGTEAAGMSSGVSGLSAEQQRRIEENRNRAREKLAFRKQQDKTSTAEASQRQHLLLPPQMPPQTATHSKVPHAREGIGKYFTGKTHPECSLTTKQTTITDGKFSTCSQQTSRPVASGNIVKYTELVKRTVKGNLTLVSRQRFEIVIPYDKLAIEVFKKTPSNMYNAKTSVWSFGVEAYDKLVASLQKECQYIELNQIPKAVVSLFRSLLPAHSKQCHSSTKNECSWNGVGTKLSSTLMQFQREGVEYCIRCGGRALLADDMGLGKTLQALAVMNHYRSNWPLLIICPSSVRMTWAEACKQWVSSLMEDDVTVVLTGKLPTNSSPITIISYDLATKLATQLAQRKPDAIIVDESHFLKNYKTNRSKAILPLVKCASRCLMLSGTPALSRPIELYTQISALDKSFRMSLVNFGIRYCGGAKNNFGWDFSGASNLNELHLYMQEKFMIRRLKTEVLDQLPSKTRQTVLLDPSLTKTQSREVRELRKELEKAGMCKAMDKHSALLPLFEKTGRLKLPAVRSYILDLLEGGRKLIVFGHHKSVLDSISECLLSKGYEHIRIDGRTPAETRQLLCDRFQHDDSCLVAVLSITTANAGLTLTASSTVVFAELFWNPGILVQAEDRVYRIGQKNCVNIHYLVARETVDDFIWPLIQNKLTVLNKAGLAVDDFSSADSTVLKSSETQRNLFDMFGEELNTMESSTLSIDSREDDTAGGEDTTLLDDPKKNKKRKRMMVEPYSDDDPDFTPQSGKQKKNSRNTKQKTLPAMCSESSNSEGREKEQLETAEHCEPSKAADLASYLLSQQSVGGVSTSTTRSSLSGVAKPATCCTVEDDLIKVQRTTTSGLTAGRGQVSTESPSNCHLHRMCTQCQSTCTCQPPYCTTRGFNHKLPQPTTDETASGSSNSCKWLDNLADSDLSSFEYFDT